MFANASTFRVCVISDNELISTATLPPRLSMCAMAPAALPAGLLIDTCKRWGPCVLSTEPAAVDGLLRGLFVFKAKFLRAPRLHEMCEMHERQRRGMVHAMWHQVKEMFDRPTSTYLSTSMAPLQMLAAMHADKRHRSRVGLK